MTTESILRFIDQNWFGFVLTIVSSAATLIWGYWLAKRDKEPYVSMKTTCLISGVTNIVPDLKITYFGDGQPLQNISVSKLAFWNAGRVPINKEDVIKPISIQIASPYRILAYSKVHVSDDANGFEIVRKADRSMVTLTFKYVDFKDGCTIQVVHTAPDATALTVNGKIKGGILHRIDSPTQRSRLKDLSIFVFVGMPLWSICLISSIAGIEKLGIVHTAVSTIVASVFLLLNTLSILLVIFSRQVPFPFDSSVQPTSLNTEAEQLGS